MKFRVNYRGITHRAGGYIPVGTVVDAEEFLADSSKLWVFERNGWITVVA